MPERVDGHRPRGLSQWPLARKLARYSAASVVGVVTSQVTLVVCFTLVGMAAVPSNVIAVTLGAVPNYLINRAWTFNKRDGHSLTREVLPFWGMALAGLVLSTFVVAWADDRTDGSTIALMAANIAAFGVLWLAKFVVLDRVLFPVTSTLPPPPPLPDHASAD